MVRNIFPTDYTDRHKYISEQSVLSVGPKHSKHMVKHIVFFRLLDEAEGKTKMENALIIRDGLLALKDKIDVLVDETVGINIPNAKNTDHDICLTCTFRTWEDLDTYATHPEHVKVAQYIGKCKSARSAVDYEE